MKAWDDGLRWHWELVEPPTIEPFELAFVRDQHLRVASGTLEDSYIQQLIKVARRQGERRTRRAFPTQTIRQVMNAFPCNAGCIELARPPLQSISSFTYVDENGDEQTLEGSPASYQVVNPAGNRRAYLLPLVDEQWPATQIGLEAAVTIEYVAGYADYELPEDLAHGMLLLIGELYKQRSETVDKTMTKAYRNACAFWDDYRIY